MARFAYAALAALAVLAVGAYVGALIVAAPPASATVQGGEDSTDVKHYVLTDGENSETFKLTPGLWICWVTDSGGAWGGATVALEYDDTYGATWVAVEVAGLDSETADTGLQSLQTAPVDYRWNVTGGSGATLDAFCGRAER